MMIKQKFGFRPRVFLIKLCNLSYMRSKGSLYLIKIRAFRVMCKSLDISLECGYRFAYRFVLENLRRKVTIFFC
jgi:hypothetical protein